MTVALHPGLCSVTFRALHPDAIIALAAEAGLRGIEWGGDVHVLPGQTKKAEELAKRCAEAGLQCPSYGSYFFAGFSEPDDLGPVMDVTKALGANTVRVWTPFGVLPDASPDERARVTNALAATATTVREAGLRTALEFHPGTLTHTAASTATLLGEVGAGNVFTYWQPEPGTTDQHALAEFHRLRHDLAHLHVFSWDPDSDHRRPLDHFAGMWRTVLNEARADERWGQERFAYLEFVADDDPEQFHRDAATLTRWLTETAP